MRISTEKRPPVQNQRCWQCKTPHNTKTNNYRVTWGNQTEKPALIGYYCSRECLWQWFSDNWETL